MYVCQHMCSYSLHNTYPCTAYNPQERAKAIKAMRKLAGYLRGSRYFDDILVLTKPRVPIIKVLTTTSQRHNTIVVGTVVCTDQSSLQQHTVSLTSRRAARHLLRHLL